MWLAVAVLCLGALGACAPDADKSKSQESAPAEIGPAISVSDAWIPLPPDGAVTAAGFATIANQGGADRLVSVVSDIASSVEIHDTIETNGVKKMAMAKDGFAAMGGGVLTLAPAGKHIMFIGLNRKLTPGETIELTLNFEKAGPVKTGFVVRDGGAHLHDEGHGDHSGHKH
jgi:copper(I)-binding protein